MAVVALDDTDPIDAKALAYREEMQAAKSRGKFYGSTSAEAIWQDGRISDHILTTKRRQKSVAMAGGQ